MSSATLKGAHGWRESRGLNLPQNVCINQLNSVGSSYYFVMFPHWKVCVCVLLLHSVCCLRLGSELLRDCADVTGAGVCRARGGGGRWEPKVVAHLLHHANIATSQLRPTGVDCLLCVLRSGLSADELSRGADCLQSREPQLISVVRGLLLRLPRSPRRYLRKVCSRRLPAARSRSERLVEAGR